MFAAHSAFPTFASLWSDKDHVKAAPGSECMGPSCQSLLTTDIPKGACSWIAFPYNFDNTSHGETAVILDRLSDAKEVCANIGIPGSDFSA